MTIPPRMEAPERPGDPVDSPDPDEESSKRDGGPEPDEPMPAGAPEVPADEPKED